MKTNYLQESKLFFFVKEKARLEEALLSEGGQQQLKIRTLKIQINKQTEKIKSLQDLIEQAKIKKEEKRNLALQVKCLVLFEISCNIFSFSSRLKNSMNN